MKLDGMTIALLAVGAVVIYGAYKNREEMERVASLTKKDATPPQILSVTRSWTDRAIEAGVS